MNTNIKLSGIAVVAGLFFGACTDTALHYDASGSFEAKEVIVSSQANGSIVNFGYEEGDKIKKGAVAVFIDSSDYRLQKEQIEASMEAVGAKTAQAKPQVDILKAQIVAQEQQLKVYDQQIANLEGEQARFQKLVAADAATGKSLDDLNAQLKVVREQYIGAEKQIKVLQQQIASQQEMVSIQNNGILSEKLPLQKRLDLLNDQLSKTMVINPVSGTLLVKYAEQGELAVMGKPLYKIANLDTLDFRAYISGDQLPVIKLGQAVEVMVDNGSGAFKSYPGKISWIADEAEFTPKTVITKDERSNLVYAIKVEVPNDGYLKLGMYGELALSKSEE
ncbi:MAG: efflux RND transporter periplasmic adaptor subunit [Saprospiraceae bacterium]|nr:efflux RND transporter periplasmic adaptor subunit [Saprospiraceae bacterium]